MKSGESRTKYALNLHKRHFSQKYQYAFVLKFYITLSTLEIHVDVFLRQWKMIQQFSFFWIVEYWGTLYSYYIPNGVRHVFLLADVQK